MDKASWTARGSQSIAIAETKKKISAEFFRKIKSVLF